MLDAYALNECGKIHNNGKIHCWCFIAHVFFHILIFLSESVLVLVTQKYICTTANIKCRHSLQV